MQCPRCQHENPPGMKFCGECAAPLAAVCPSCGAGNPPENKFCGHCATPLRTGPTAKFAAPDSYTPKHLAAKILTSKAALEGERKQVTVLFADLKGSMELLADRDPEEARKILDPVLEIMMEAVHRYEGTVNQVMGDGVMALFGAPLAHEDHAVRACYAALRMQESVKRHAEDARGVDGVNVKIRVGLNSGEVVVRAIGSDLRMDYTAVGQTTHLAARMEQLAPPGAIRLTAETLRLANGFVQVDGVGPTPVKGVSEPVDVYELVGANGIRSRFQAHVTRGLTKFVGRAIEIEQLSLALAQARAGRGQVVAVVGEPGVGKSRLFWEFTRSHLTKDCLIVEAGSVSYGKATSYLPVIELLRAYFQIEERDDQRKIHEKVTGKLLSLDRTLEPWLTALLALLDVPVADEEWTRLDPPQRRHRTLDGLKRLLLRQAHVQPLIVVFEDLHWIDGETQAMLDGLVENLSTARLLLLVSYRPEYQHVWDRKTCYRQLRMDALPAESVEELLEGLLGVGEELSSLKRLLIDRAEGNPFFLEESVRALVETGALSGDRGTYRLAKPLRMLQVPATAQAILAARIDRLSTEDKRLLQMASVVGKDVPVALLQAIVETDAAAVNAVLSRLQAAEFLYEVPLLHEAEYTFKHALTHEVTYGTLLWARRRTLHARLVDAIERLHAGRLDEQVDRLAQHAQRGELWDKVVTYSSQAAARAMGRGDLRLAAASFEAALTAAVRLPQGRETQAVSVDLTLGLGTAFEHLGELDRTLDTAQRALTLAEELGDGERIMDATALLMHARYNAGDAAGAAALGERALVLADAHRHEIQQVRLGFSLARAYLSLGDYRQAIALLERNRASWRGRDAGVASRAFLAMGLAIVGEFSRATAVAKEGATLSGPRDTAQNRFCVLYGLSAAAFWRGQYEIAIPSLEQGLALVRELNFLIWLPAFAALLGYAYAHTQRLAEGLGLLEEATIQEETRNRVSRARHLGLQSEALLLSGQPGDAWAAAQRGLDGARARSERGHEALCLRALGEAEMSGNLPDAEAARMHLQQALALATELGMRPLVAHCHLGLGKLYRCTGKREQAQEDLTTATTMYREMDMPYWLEQAEADRDT